jgi:hypothetical protein
MRKMRMAVGSLVGAALMAGAVTPAYADGWNRGGWGRHHRYHDGFGFGDALGVAALIGAVAIVAGSVSRDKAVARDRSAPPPDDRYDGGYDRGGYDNAPYGDPRGSSYEGDGRHDDGSVADARGDGRAASSDLSREESDAVDSCAVAARDRASEQGGYAEVLEIGDPQPASGGWNIDGRVERRTSYRDSGGETRRFTCSVRNGRVAEVYLSRDVAMN